MAAVRGCHTCIASTALLSPQTLSSSSRRWPRPASASWRLPPGAPATAAVATTIALRRARAAHCHLQRRAATSTASPAGKEAGVHWQRWRAGNFHLTEASFDTTPFAEYWGSLAGRSLAADDFFGRQAIYARLIGEPSLAHLFVREDGLLVHGLPTRHFLWAYAAQLDWQWRSGRLGVPGSAAISPDSWWGGMNYTLCALPLAAAMDAGVLEVPCAGLEEAARPELAAARASWADVWRSVAHRAEASAERGLSPRERDELQGEVWQAHTATLQAASNLYAAQLDMLPPEEQAFGLGWSRFVEVLAAVRWRTDLDYLAQTGAGYLPGGILGSPGAASGIPPSGEWQEEELRRVEESVRITHQTAAMSEVALARLVRFWQRSGRNFQRRAAAAAVVQDLSAPGLAKVRAAARLLWWFLFPGKAD
mmetsp:Transcript_54128/g.169032  ORF Transcript_54128/g.169032 Transcript_54128/m.169032 type:complete len:422 (-) Transcript_54128:54-1319(-)